MLPLLCRICQKPVALGDLLLPTGPVCKACDTPENVPVCETGASAKANCDPSDLEVAMSLSESETPGAAIPDFDLPRGASGVSIEVEEWLHVHGPGGWAVAASWNERYPGRLASRGSRRVAFAVVLSWRGTSGKPFRDIGPLAWVGRYLDDQALARANALNSALGWARRQARRLGLPAPDSYLPARTDFPGGV